MNPQSCPLPTPNSLTGCVVQSNTTFDPGEGLTQPYDAPRRIIKTITPDFSESNIIRYKAGFRPIHNIRPQIGANVVVAQGKTFLSVDCWGHGGAGITLAPGSVNMAYRELLKVSQKESIDFKKRPIAILGAGINGLWMANFLAKQEVKNITVFAKDFQNTVSHVAAGMWLPISMPRGGGDPQFFVTLEDESHHEFSALASSDKPEYAGVKELPLYTLNVDDLPRSMAMRGLVPKGEPVTLKNQHGHSADVILWKKFFLVDPSFLMPSLTEKARKRGVKFVERTFVKESEFYELGAAVVINCLGLGNQELLTEGKANLLASKGEILYLNPQPIDHMFFGVDKEGRRIGYMPKEEGLCVGVTWKSNDLTAEPNKEDAKKLLAIGQGIFK